MLLIFVSAPEFEFISGLAPEIKVSEEHAENFAYNCVSFRVVRKWQDSLRRFDAMVKITLPPLNLEFYQ